MIILIKINIILFNYLIILINNFIYLFNNFIYFIKENSYIIQKIKLKEINDKLKLEKKEKMKIKEQERKKIKKKEILERQQNLRENKELNKEDKNLKLLEDMCILGSILKEEILTEKKNNSEKYIPTQDAIKNKENKQIFLLGLLAQKLENIGIITAIENNPNNDDESQNESNTILQFITNGMVEKSKFCFHFDLGPKRNNELLTNKIEQQKFNAKLKKKLSLEYQIPENEIIITNPQRGSYQVQIIFQSDDFNDINIDINEIKLKCKNEKDFKEISYLRNIQKSLIMEGCKLSTNMLDPEGNREKGWGKGEKRGGLDYFPPLNGWKGFGLKVTDIYDNGNNDWLAHNGNKNEWAVAYHGIGTKMNCSLEKATSSIIKGGFKPGLGQQYEKDDDAMHPGQKVGRGVYCSPNPDVMEDYAKRAQTEIIVEGKKFMMGFMMRVKPDKIRYSNNKKEFWVLNGTTDEMRPYRILVKEY